MSALGRRCSGEHPRRVGNTQERTPRDAPASAATDRGPGSCLPLTRRSHDERAKPASFSVRRGKLRHPGRCVRIFSSVIEGRSRIPRVQGLPRHLTRRLGLRSSGLGRAGGGVLVCAYGAKWVPSDTRHALEWVQYQARRPDRAVTLGVNGEGQRMALGDVAQRVAEIRRVARVHGVRRLRVVGSRGRGEARANSDIDLLVDLRPGRDLLDLAGFKLDLEDVLGCKVDVVTERSLSPHLRERIVAEARPL